MSWVKKLRVLQKKKCNRGEYCYRFDFINTRECSYIIAFGEDYLNFGQLEIEVKIKPFSNAKIMRGVCGYTVVRMIR